jgi:hypothetical protein
MSHTGCWTKRRRSGDGSRKRTSNLFYIIGGPNRIWLLDNEEASDSKETKSRHQTLIRCRAWTGLGIAPSWVSLVPEQLSSVAKVPTWAMALARGWTPFESNPPICAPVHYFMRDLVAFRFFRHWVGVMPLQRRSARVKALASA